MFDSDDVVLAGKVLVIFVLLLLILMFALGYGVASCTFPSVN